MIAKINTSALLTALSITLIYVAGGVLFSVFWGGPDPFFMNHRVQSSIYGLFISILYWSGTTFAVFILVKTKERRNAFLLKKLELADETLESRVKLRTAEIEKTFSTLNTLKGIIPICAHCKSIRNGSGQWEPIECYVKKHSEAEFSHGLCPDCDKKLYGDRHQHFKTIAGKYS